MKYVNFAKGCEPNELSILECETPRVFGSQVLIEVKSFGVNRADTLQRKGLYPPPQSESPILGLEVAGVVVGLGPNANQWALGDNVFGLVAGGGYAEYVAVEQSHLMSIPKDFSYAQAASVAEVFLTAYQALYELGNLQSKQSLLVHAGASGVGLAAIQLAAIQECTVVATTSSQRKIETCERFGANLCINYQEERFKDIIRDQVKGIDLIVDVVGGEYLNDNIRLLNMDGTLVQLAMLGGRYTQQFDMAMMLSKRATIKASTLRNRDDGYKSQLIAGFSHQFLSSFDNGILSPVIDTVFPVEQTALAHERLERNDSIGKFVVNW